MTVKHRVIQSILYRGRQDVKWKKIGRYRLFWKEKLKKKEQEDMIE